MAVACLFHRYYRTAFLLFSFLAWSFLSPIDRAFADNANVFDHIFRETSRYVQAIDGRYLFPHSDSFIGPSLQLFGQYEKPMKDICFQLIREYLDDHPNDHGVVILDIGSNIGTWTVPLSSLLGSRGRVYAFEAQLEMMNYLHTNVLLNQRSNVYPMHAIITNVSGTLRLKGEYFGEGTGQEHVNHGAMSIGLASDSVDSTAELSSYLVNQIRLDDLLAQGYFPKCPIFVKLDIEMHELSALLGARQLLSTCHPILLIEATCALLVKSLVALLDDAGYSLAWLGGVLSIDFDSPFPDIDTYPDRFDQEFFGDINRGGMFLTEGDNILAVPKHMASRLQEFNSRGPIQSPLLFPIDIVKGNIYVDQFNITICYKGFWCKAKKLNPNYNSTHCVDEEIDRFNQYFWMELEQSKPAMPVLPTDN